jgi:hypothetical protein
LAEHAGRETSSGDPHLRSGNEVRGYHIEAIDGRIGHLDELLIDAESWRISYVELDTRNYWPGRHVPIAHTQRSRSVSSESRSSTST